MGQEKEVSRQMVARRLSYDVVPWRPSFQGRQAPTNRERAIRRAKGL
jgi:hypothetical protein